jgi:AhpD family alkylhydroperoxidase
MSPRFRYKAAAPGVFKAMLDLEAQVEQSGLEPALMELVRLRASQINGCAFCLDMHATNLRNLGQRQIRLEVLQAWRETDLFSERERAALAWTEAVTLVAESHVPDEDYAEARRYFSERELAELTLGIVAINGWNRLNVAFRTAPAGWASGHPPTDVVTAVDAPATSSDG